MGTGKIFVTSNGTSWDLSTDTSETDIRSLATFTTYFKTGCIVNDSSGNSAISLGVNDDDTGLIILKGADGNDHKLFINSAGNLDNSTI